MTHYNWLRAPRLVWFLGLCMVILQAGCASVSSPAVDMGKVKGPYVLEGPPLYIAGEYQGKELAGRMDRPVMVGMGIIRLYERATPDVVFCEGKLDAEPQKKGRITGVMHGPSGEVFTFTLQPNGPDQGVGIARTDTSPDVMVLFFHSCREEVWRRLPLVQRSMEAAVNNTKKRE